MSKFLDYVSLDLETTGLDANICDIIEIAMIKVRGGEIVDRFESFVFTPLDITQHVQFLTGISKKDVENAPDFRDLISKVEEFIGDDPLMGHNILFDKTFLVEKGCKVQDNALWDTYLMSNILYPDLPSHSLETNTKYFNIGHADSHRAMADVMACHHLWKILMNTFPKVNPEQREKIQSLNSKTAWPLMEYFLQEREEQNVPFEIDQHQDFSSRELQNIPPSSGNHQLILAAGNDPVNVASNFKTTGRSVYIAGYEHTQQKLMQSFEGAIRIFPAYNYLQPKRVEELMNQEQLETGQATLLLKTIIFPEFIHRDQLVLSHPERAHWNLINVQDEKSDSPYQDTLKKATEASHIITSHFHLLKNPELLEAADNLIILEPQLLEDNATRTFGKRLNKSDWDYKSSDESWIEKGEKFFEELDRFGNKLVPNSQYPEHMMLTPMITESNEFIRLKSQIKSIREEESNEDLKAYLKFFEAFFLLGDPFWVRWVTVDPRFGTSFNIAPLSVKSLIEKNLMSGPPVTVISDTADTFSALPEMPVEQVDNPHELEIIEPTLEEITGTKKEGDFAAQGSFLTKLLPTLKGKTGVIFGSKSALKRIFFDINKSFSAEMGAYAEDLSGGTGKLRDRYQSDSHDSKVIFLTYRNLRAMAPEIMDFDQIILQSLPFDPPGYPVNQARSEMCNNAFGDFVIPRVQLNLLEILTNFSKRDGKRSLYLMDRRIQEKGYAKDIISIIE